MTHRGSCHCGRVAFEVDGDVEQVIECNCSHCDRKGFLLWFVPRSNFRLTSGVDDLRAYTFNKHVIQHQFCTTCGTQAFAFGKDRNGNETAAINVRCLPDLDRSRLKVMQVDGRSF
ncbi:MAG TPA: GFA family protein [Candidatus Binatia bacterium]